MTKKKGKMEKRRFFVLNLGTGDFSECSSPKDAAEEVAMILGEEGLDNRDTQEWVNENLIVVSESALKKAARTVTVDAKYDVTFGGGE